MRTFSQDFGGTGMTLSGIFKLDLALHQPNVANEREAGELHRQEPKNGPARGWLSMRASGRLWTIKPWISRGFARLLTSCWMLPEVFGTGRWWAVGD